MVCHIATALLRLLTYSWHMLAWLLRLTASTDSSRWMRRNACILMNSMTLLCGEEIVHRWSAYITKGPMWLCLTLHQVLVKGVSHWLCGLRVELRRRWDMRRWISCVSSYTRELCLGSSEPRLAGSSRPPWGCRSTGGSGSNWLSRCWDGASQTWSPVRAIIPTSLELPFSGAA